MGDRTVVDTARLGAAARAAGTASSDVRGSAQGARSALSALAGGLPGTLTGREVTALSEALGGATGELAEALRQLGLLLSVAAVRYADAEDVATATGGASAAGTSATPAGS